MAKDEKRNEHQRQYQRGSRNLLFVMAGCGSFWPFSRWLSEPSSVADNERAPSHTTAANSVFLSLSRESTLRYYNRNYPSLPPWFPTATLARFTFSANDVNRWATRMRPNQRACVGLLSIRSTTASSPSGLLTSVVDDDESCRRCVPRNR